MNPSDPRTSDRATHTARAALVSILSNTLLTTAKLVVGFTTGSISVASEGLHSGNDLVASLLAFFSVRRANEPADEHHAYGHGKYEAVSGAVEAVLIILAAGAMSYVAIRSLALGQFDEIHHTPALAVMAFSTLANIIVSTYLYRVAARYDSLALEADAAHLRVDVYTSAGVFVGLGVIRILGLLGREALWIDPALALMVAALVVTQGWSIAKLAVNQLLDHALPEDEVARIVATLRTHDERFVGFHKLRSRRAGHQRHIDLHLVMCDAITLAEAHDLTDHLEEEIAALFPESQTMIHIEPCGREECERLRRQGSWQHCTRTSSQPDVDASQD